MLERSALLARSDGLTGDHLRSILSTESAAPGGVGVAGELVRSLGRNWLERPLAVFRREVAAEVERHYFDLQLRAAGGRVGEVARRAGIAPRSLHRILNQLGLRKEDYQERRASGSGAARARRRQPPG